MLESPWFGNGKIHFTVKDELGKRILVVPDSEVRWSGEPIGIILDIEARTRTRLKNGANPIKFHRAYSHWRDRRDSNSTVTFAEFCLRRHSEAVDVLDNEATARLQTMFGRGERSASTKPQYDGDRRELRIGRKVVKRFRRPAPNQEVVLKAFQEEGWPTRIDDPTPNGRLRETLRALNEKQKEGHVRFEADGTGKGIVWVPIPRSRGQRTSRARPT